MLSIIINHRKMYSCSLGGQCEADPRGEYDLPTCQSECQGTDSRVLIDIIHDYAPRTTQLAPSDRTSLLRRVIGLVIKDPEVTFRVLSVIDEGGIEALGTDQYTRTQLLRLGTPEAYALVLAPLTSNELMTVSRAAIREHQFSFLKELVNTNDYLQGNDALMETGLMSDDPDIVRYFLGAKKYDYMELYRSLLRKRPATFLRELTQEYIPEWLMELIVRFGPPQLLTIPSVAEWIRQLPLDEFEDIVRLSEDVETLSIVLAEIVRRFPSYHPKGYVLEVAVKKRLTPLVKRALPTDLRMLKLDKTSREWVQSIMR